ncbi:AMP-binding protein [Kutzneria sp. 744]|uniref:AMP-binding protein n=1 Tax=Kutzneria sp. (strain 744) TaxID=345341 RepID=UPI0004B3215D|nr:AMP-binding protein [Kutzneria sp. 744]
MSVPPEWNATDRPLPARTLAQLVEAQVARTPGAPALLGADGTVSYAELDARANRLARLLAAHGAAPERIVALALPRSADLVAAQLAVAKTGAAFLPVDPDYPKERISLMFDDADPVLVVTRRALADRLPAAVPTISMDTPDLLDDHDDRPLDRPQCTDHAAYVIFTSGSTGRPKGVGSTSGGGTGPSIHPINPAESSVLHQRGVRSRDLLATEEQCSVPRGPIQSSATIGPERAVPTLPY